MTGPSRNRKVLILIAGLLSCVAIALTIGFVAYPTPVANAALGAGWQCHRSAGIVTTCNRVSHVTPMMHRTSGQPALPQRV
jgi:hypothetical protein